MYVDKNNDGIFQEIISRHQSDTVLWQVVLDFIIQSWVRKNCSNTTDQESRSDFLNMRG